MFHDIMGHLPLFLNPRFASFFYEWGQAGLRASTPSDITSLGRIYWFAVEFGLINPSAHDGARRENDDCRIYGAGIASSVGEIVHSLTSKVVKRPFNIGEIAERNFDIHHMQDTLYEISSFAELEEEFVGWARARKLLPSPKPA
jgi:phenylalanine-4-hydroxylase